MEFIYLDTTFNNNPGKNVELHNSMKFKVPHNKKSSCFWKANTCLLGLLDLL